MIIPALLGLIFWNKRVKCCFNFVKFKNFVENEFEKKIECLRIDNGGEFMWNEFFQYCENNGIQRQITCPNTSQQNGVTEWKLAYLSSRLS